MVQSTGIELQNLSGPLNLHEWWLQTDHTLAPQGRPDLVPPVNIAIPTDSLFEARQRAADAFDRQSVQLPDGRWQTVGRLDPIADFGVLQPIYASYREIRQGPFSERCLSDHPPSASSRIARWARPLQR